MEPGLDLYQMVKRQSESRWRRSARKVNSFLGIELVSQVKGQGLRDSACHDESADTRNSFRKGDV
jgi:hypothetical protein